MTKKLFSILVFIVALAPFARAGHFVNEAVSATPVQVSATATGIFKARIVNRDAVNPIFIHIYDALAANVTVGTTAQYDCIAVPANGAYVLPNTGVAQFATSTALTIAITTSPLSTGTTAPGTAAVVVFDYNP
jgi:hypothetical protein